MYVDQEQPEFSTERNDDDIPVHIVSNEDLSSPLTRYSSSAVHSQHNYKFILVGNSRVGKTSLINRFIFDEFEEGEQATRVC